MPILSGVIASSVGVPGAPTIGTVTISGTTATVPFTAPSDNGGSTITSYTAVSNPGGITGTLNQAGSGSITVAGLTGGTSYTFTVYATNAFGNGPSSSASNSVTAVAAGTAFVSVGFYNTYPGSEGRGANYTVSWSDDNSSWTTAWSGNSTAYSCGNTNSSGGGGSYGTHRYWRYVVGGATLNGHHPRCSKIYLKVSNGSQTNIKVYTSDNCSDGGGIPGLDQPSTIVFDAVTNTTLSGQDYKKCPDI